jgi:DNA-binding CsgD family transcriptional regulator
MSASSAQLHLDPVRRPVPASLPARASVAVGDRSASQDPLASCLLDALPVCAVVVDGASMVRLASVAGIEAIRRPGSGVAIRPAMPGGGGAMALTALHREDAATLRRLVAAAAHGGTGGSLRIHPRDADGAQEGMQVVVVSPLPAGAGGGAGLVLVKIEDLVRRAAPPAAMLCDLFGFSAAEAEVALRLVGGASADEVALSRGVALDTVRGQIRAILRKSEATNLRDFERLMATLAKIGAATAAPMRWS